MADNDGANAHTNIGILDYLFGDSETSVSSSSGDEEVFGSHTHNDPYVLQLHDIKRDDSAIPAAMEKPKTRRKRKKSKEQDKAQSPTGSNSADSESSMGTEDTAKEEFFDAQGSIHTIKENPAPLAAAPVPGAALVIAHSEHGQALKTTEQTPVVQLESDSTIPLPLPPPTKTTTKPSQK